MNSKHTPGPWKRGKTHPENISAGSALVCVVSKRSKFTNEQEANAHLIAAAPELLEALESLVAELTERTHEDGRMMSASYVRGEVCKVSTLESAKAAIAKAKGEA